MGGSVKARRIFFRKPLDCFQALYVIRVFFSAGKFFPKVFPCKSFFFPSNPVYGNIIHIPSSQKSNGMIAGSDLWWLVRLSTRRCKRTSPVSAEKKKEFPLVVLNYTDNNSNVFAFLTLMIWLVGTGRWGVLSIMTCTEFPFSASGKWRGRYFISWILWTKVRDIYHLKKDQKGLTGADRFKRDKLLG